MARMKKPADLPQKICATCGRPFHWRRKWARDWPEVKYCSKRCAGTPRKKVAKTDRKPSIPSIIGEI